jgi:hypothetical protein
MTITAPKRSRGIIVNITIRSKFDDKLISTKKMTRAEAISFSAIWDFHHGDSEYYIQIEDIK